MVNQYGDKNKSRKNGTLSIINSIRLYSKLPELSTLNISRRTLNRTLKKLMLDDIISKIGYGTYNLNKSDIEIKNYIFQVKECAKNNIGHPKTFIRDAYPKMAHSYNSNIDIKKDRLKVGSVRGHGFMFRLRLPRKLRNWGRRAEILRRKGIKVDPLRFCGVALTFRGRRVHLWDKSIVVYEKSSYFQDNARDGYNFALYEIRKLFRGLERLLGASFSVKGGFFVRVRKQHYGQVRNSLAVQYTRKGKFLDVADENGFWLKIDNSKSKDGAFGLQELETVHPVTAVEDMDEVIIPFFNDLKKHKDFSPSWVINCFGMLLEDRRFHAENMNSHIRAVQKLEVNVDMLGVAVRKLTEKVMELGDYGLGKDK